MHLLGIVLGMGIEGKSAAQQAFEHQKSLGTGIVYDSGNVVVVRVTEPDGMRLIVFPKKTGGAVGEVVRSSDFTQPKSSRKRAI